VLDKPKSDGSELSKPPEKGVASVDRSRHPVVARNMPDDIWRDKPLDQFEVARTKSFRGPPVRDGVGMVGGHAH
jgi:hypothetical protein